MAECLIEWHEHPRQFWSFEDKFFYEFFGYYLRLKVIKDLKYHPSYEAIQSGKIEDRTYG